MDKHSLHISQRIHSDHAFLVDQGVIEFEELNEEGKGTVRFVVDCCALKVIHRHKPPIKWTKNQKCADGAVVIRDNDDIVLHVIELKKKVTPSNWIDIKSQFEGMVLNVKAMLAISDIPQPTSIICHVGYEEETISPGLSTDPALLKLSLGGAFPVPGAFEWSNEEISLLNTEGVPVRKIVRDPATSEGEGVLN